MRETLQSIADSLDAAARSGIPIAPINSRLPTDDLEHAYAVQTINTQRQLERGRRLTGRKIGLTSVAVQKQFGVDQPDFGMLFAHMAVDQSEDIAWGRMIQPKCEAEIALVLERDITDPEITLCDIITAAAYVLPAIEVVDSRIANWKIAITDTVADNASAGLYVLGARPTRLSDIDLRMAGMVMERRGRCISYGVGAASLGHPLYAALWLARTLVRNGMPLQAGDLVLTGALSPAVEVEPGDLIEVVVDGLGTVKARFGAGSSDGGTSIA